jgi:hypothetical protein
MERLCCCTNGVPARASHEYTHASRHGETLAGVRRRDQTGANGQPWRALSAMTPRSISATLDIWRDRPTTDSYVAKLSAQITPHRDRPMVVRRPRCT